LLSDVPLHSDLAEIQPFLDLFYSYTTNAGLLGEFFLNLGKNKNMNFTIETLEKIPGNTRNYFLKTRKTNTV
jgi:hypothetical protein